MSPHLERLQELYRAGFQDYFVDNALQKIINHQIARDKADLQQINQKLTELEQQYQLTSDEFWQRYQAGQMAGTADFIEWIAFCKMKRRLISRLSVLVEGDV